MLQMPQNNEYNNDIYEVEQDEIIADVNTRNDLIFYSVKDVARMLSVSIPTAREIMYRADFPCIKINKLLRVSKSAFEQWAMEKRM